MRVRLFLGFMILCFAVALDLAGAAQPAAATRSKVVTQEQPTIKKDSIIIWAWKVPSYRGNFDTWSWLPRMRYTVNGPLPSGGQLYVEFSMLGTGSWVKFDCDTGEIDKDHWWGTECG